MAAAELGRVERGHRPARPLGAGAGGETGLFGRMFGLPASDMDSSPFQKTSAPVGGA